MKYLYGFLVLLGVFLVVTLIRAAFFKPKMKAAQPLLPERVNTERFIRRLSEALTFKTIADRDKSKIDFSEFERFHDFLRRSYPLLHETLSLEKVAEASLLYRWKGRDSSLPAVALLAHQDVVPISAGTLGDWTHPPFDGVSDGEFLWGRGALDMKNHLIGVMESVETLLEEDFVPERDVYLCFGHDEEVMAAGDCGARAIAELLASRGVKLDCALDEGGAILPVNVKGVLDCRLAGIGVAEKGHADFRVSVLAKGGHSSQPPNHSALGELALSIRKLENHQFPSKMTPLMHALLDQLGRNASYPIRVVLCNLRLLRPLVVAAMKKIPPAACMIRTTTAVTQAEGSPAPNVLPQKASVTVNLRIMPGITVSDVEAHIKRTVGKKAQVELIKGEEPSHISPIDSRAFKAIEDICRGMNEKNIVAPYLVMGGTDARQYEDICQNVYRYSPFLVNTSLLLTCHATNERIPLSSLEDGVAFFKRYIKKLSQK